MSAEDEDIAVVRCTILSRKLHGTGDCETPPPPQKFARSRVLSAQHSEQPSTRLRPHYRPPLHRSSSMSGVSLGMVLETEGEETGSTQLKEKICVAVSELDDSDPNFSRVTKYIQWAKEQLGSAECIPDTLDREIETSLFEEIAVDQ